MWKRVAWRRSLYNLCRRPFFSILLPAKDEIYSRFRVNTKINEVLRVVDEIQAHSRPVIEHCYRDFLLQNNDPEVCEYPDAADLIREMLIHENYLSQKDIDFCLGFDLTGLENQPEIDSIRALHEVLKLEYGPDDKHGAS